LTVVSAGEAPVTLGSVRVAFFIMIKSAAKLRIA
jgi:hypothetical protein